MHKNWRLAVLAAALACQAGSLFAQPARGPFDQARGGCAGALAQAVGLTSAQQSALDALRQQTAGTIQPLADQAVALHEQIDMALSASSPDRCAIGDLVIQAHALRVQIQTIVKNAEASFVASLSADQQTKYTAFVAAHPGCTFIFHGPGHGLPPPA